MSEGREKRERKAPVATYQVETPTKKEFVIPVGKGTKLGDIPNIEFKLNKVKADDELLTLIHRIMYGTPGKRTVIKKNIREFSGFVFDGADGDKEKAKKEDVISRAFTNTLNQMLDLFDLPRGSGAEGNKEARVARLVKFLEKPEASDNKNLKAGCVG